MKGQWNDRFRVFLLLHDYKIKLNPRVAKNLSNQRALRASSSIEWTIFIALLYPANVNQKGKEKAVRNRTNLFVILNKREWLWKRNDILSFVKHVRHPNYILWQSWNYCHVIYWNHGYFPRFLHNVYVPYVHLRPHPRSNPSFISVHTHSILSTHSIPRLMPMIVIQC